MSQPENLVCVYDAANEAEAYIMKGLLESNGISCFLKSGSSLWYRHVSITGGLGNLNIMVKESDLETARRLVAGEASV